MRSLFQHLQGMKARTMATGRHLAATIRGPVLWLTLCGGLLVALMLLGGWFARSGYAAVRS